MCPDSIITRDALGTALLAERCHECPLFRLEAALEGPFGGIIERARCLGFALEKGFRMTLGDIPCDEFNVLRILDEEQNKYQDEMDKARQ